VFPGSNGRRVPCRICPSDPITHFPLLHLYLHTRCIFLTSYNFYLAYSHGEHSIERREYEVLFGQSSRCRVYSPRIRNSSHLEEEQQRSQCTTRIFANVIAWPVWARGSMGPSCASARVPNAVPRSKKLYPSRAINSFNRMIMEMFG